MNTSKTEFLSAFLDDEAGEFERRRLVDELSRDNELGQTLSRYALVGEVMRAKQSTVLKDNRQFLAGIQAGLEDEPEYSETVVQLDAPAAAGQRHWRDNAMRFGMAASVAVAAIAGVLLLQQPDNEAPTVEVAANDAPAAKTQPLALSQMTKPVSGDNVTDNTNTMTLADSSRTREGNRHLDWQTRDALKQYITLHMQHRANNGIVPSIQAVSYTK